jgi:heme-degrading monooxygenase HmoA
MDRKEDVMSKIARVWFGKTLASRIDEYIEYVKRTGVPDLKATKGNLGVWVIKRVDGDTAELAVISFWDSREAIERFAGKNIAKAVYYPEDHHFLLNMEPELVHYDIPVDSSEPGSI